MNVLDLFIILPIGYFTYRGFMKGFIHEVLGIAGIILAVFITFRYMHNVSPLFFPFFENPDYATFCGGIFLFLVAVAMMQFFAFTMQKFLELMKIHFLNRLAGLIFGFLKSAIVISAILLLFVGFDLPGETTRGSSIAYPVIIQVAPAAYDLVASVWPEAENFVSTIEKTIQENNPIRTLPIFESSES